MSPSSAGRVQSDAAASGGKMLKIWSNASASRSVLVGESSARLVVRARGEQCGGAPQMTVSIDGTRRLATAVSATSYATYSASVTVDKGSHNLKVAFMNDYRSSSCDRNLIVDSLTLQPSTTPTPTPTPTASPTPTPTRPAPAPTVAPTTTIPVNALQIRDFARCDGTSDDTEGTQRALDALVTGQTLVIPAGVTCRHSDVLTIRRPNVRVTGPGTLTAINESRSSVRIDADNVTLDGGLTVRMASTTRRWEAYEQQKIHVAGHSGAVLRNITVDGAAAGGIYIGGAANYLIEDVVVQNTRADGIHNTDGAHDGVIRRPILRNTGDDAVAVVSYASYGTPCRNIVVEAPRAYGARARAFSVVGGNDVTFTNVYSEGSSAAALYISTEGDPYYTFAASRVKVIGGELRNSNSDTGIDHGAVLLYNARPGYVEQNVDVRDLSLINTRSTASRQIGLLGRGSGGFANIAFTNLTIQGGPATNFVTDQPSTSFFLSGVSRL